MKKSILIGAIVLTLLMLVPVLSATPVQVKQQKNAIPIEIDTQVTVTKVPTSDPTLVCYYASCTEYAYFWYHMQGQVGWTRGSGFFFFNNGQCTSIIDTSNYGLTWFGYNTGYYKKQLVHYTQKLGNKGHLYAEGHFAGPIGDDEYSWVDIVVNSNGAITYSHGHN